MAPSRRARTASAMVACSVNITTGTRGLRSSAARRIE